MGGPIGLELTGAVSSLYMWWWDKQLLYKVGELMERAEREWKVYFYMRYVDDCNIIADVMEPGVRFKDGKKMKLHEKVEEDRNVPDDKMTALVVQQIANSKCNFIEVEIDCPSMHPNNRMPILDLYRWR